MAIVVKIAGINRNDYIKPSSLTINKTYGEPWTCDFSTVDPDGGYYPNVGEPVSVEIHRSEAEVFGASSPPVMTYDLGYRVTAEPTIYVNGFLQMVGVLGDTGKDWYYEVGSTTLTQDIGGTPLTGGDDLAAEYIGLELVVFGGVVRSVERMKEFALTPVLETNVVCTDWNQVLERRLSGEYEWIETPAGTIISDIVTNSLTEEGFDVSGVAAGPTISNFRVGYGTVAEAFGELSKIAEYRLFVDEEKIIRFSDPNASPVVVPASFDIADAATNIKSLRATETDEDYCNVVVGRAGNVIRDIQSEELIGDGSATSFEVAFPVSAAPTITLNGVDQTVGVASVDTEMDWYWSQGSNEIRQDADGLVLTSADTLEVTYSGIESIYVVALDSVAILARQNIEGGSGRYEKFLEIDQMVTRADAQDIVDGYLNAHLDIPIVCTYTTDDYLEPEAKRLRPGMIQSMLLAGWAAQQTRYFVRTIKLAAIDIGSTSEIQFDYEIEIIFGSLTKTIFQWFKDLASGGSSGGGKSEGKSEEWFYFGLGGCEAVPAGTDVSAFHPMVFNSGRLTLIGSHTKVAPSSAALVFDVKRTRDGITWNSIFPTGAMTHPVGETEVITDGSFSEYANIQKGDRFRVDVTTGGAAEGWGLKLAARPYAGRVGAMLGDDSQATGLTGSNEASGLMSDE